MPLMSCKIYPESQSQSLSIEEGKKDLLRFMKNAYSYLQTQTCIVVQNREVDNKHPLALIHPNMLAWKAHMFPFFEEWVIYKNHKFMDKKGCWKNDTGNVKGRWCELEICGRRCLVDFQSSYYDDGVTYWKSTKIYNYTFIIDPYCYDDTDDNWNMDWVH